MRYTSRRWRDEARQASSLCIGPRPGDRPVVPYSVRYSVVALDIDEAGDTATERGAVVAEAGHDGDDPQDETPHFAHDARVGTAIEDRLHNAHH